MRMAEHSFQAHSFIRFKSSRFRRELAFFERDEGMRPSPRLLTHSTGHKGVAKRYTLSGSQLLTLERVLVFLQTRRMVISSTSISEP